MNPSRDPSRISRKVRVTLLSAITILVCLMLITAGTFALYSTSGKVVNHLSSGAIGIELWRNKATKSVADENGYIPQAETVDSTAVKLSDAATYVNALGLASGDLLIPGSKATAELQLKNTGDVAVGYWLQIVMTDDQGVQIADAAALNELSKQITIKVENSDGTFTQTRTTDSSDIVLAVGGENNLIGKVAKNAAGTFTVTVEFVDDGSVNDYDANKGNNKAMSQSVYFDIVVYAVQVKTA